MASMNCASFIGFVSTARSNHCAANVMFAPTPVPSSTSVLHSHPSICGASVFGADLETDSTAEFALIRFRHHRHCVRLALFRSAEEQPERRRRATVDSVRFEVHHRPSAEGQKTHVTKRPICAVGVNGHSASLARRALSGHRGGRALPHARSMQQRRPFATHASQRCPSATALGHCLPRSLEAPEAQPCTRAPHAAPSRTMSSFTVALSVNSRSKAWRAR